MGGRLFSIKIVYSRHILLFQTEKSEKKELTEKKAAEELVLRSQGIAPNTISRLGLLEGGGNRWIPRGPGNAG